MNHIEKFKCNKEYYNAFYKKLDEFYNYLITNNEFPSSSKGDCFSDGTKMRKWLYAWLYILKEMENDNEKARYIINEYEKQIQNKKDNSEKNFNSKLKEVYEYYLKTWIVPPKNSDVVFSDGTKMGIWLKNNRYKLEQLAEENDMAKVIVSIWQKNSNRQVIKEQSLTDRINEIYRYITSNNINKIDEKALFSDGTNMNNWLEENVTKLNELYGLNSKVVYIINVYMNTQKRNGTVLEKDMIEKIVEMCIYISTNKCVPGIISNDCFSDGTNMGVWLDNNIETLNSMSNNNYYISIITVAYSNKKRNENFQIKFQNKIDEVYQICQKKGFEYIYIYKIKFSDGIEMYPWLRRNYKSIYDQKEENGKARYIINELEKFDLSRIREAIARKKSYFRLSLNFNRKALEIYKYCVTKNRIPSKTCKYKLYNGADMKYWIDSNRKRIWESRFRNPYCLKLVKEILEIDKEFFNNISDEESSSKINDRGVSKRYKLLIK